MPTATDDTQPSMSPTPDKAAHARIKTLEQEMHGGPGSNGVKGHVAVLQSDVEGMSAMLRELDRKVDLIIAELGTPRWAWTATFVLVSILSGVLTLAVCHWAGWV